MVRIVDITAEERDDALLSALRSGKVSLDLTPNQRKALKVSGYDALVEVNDRHRTAPQEPAGHERP